MGWRSYTPEDEARLRHGYLTLESLKSIASALGRSQDTIRQKAKRMGLSHEDRKSRHVREQMRERHEEPGFTETLHQAANTTEAKVKRSASMKALWARPGYREFAGIRLARAWEARRGFSIPSDRRAEYDLLIRKKFTAQEAGELLGLIPSSTSQDRRA